MATDLCMLSFYNNQLQFTVHTLITVKHNLQHNKLYFVYPQLVNNC